MYEILRRKNVNNFEEAKANVLGGEVALWSEQVHFTQALWSEQVHATQQKILCLFYTISHCIS